MEEKEMTYRLARLEDRLLVSFSRSFSLASKILFAVPDLKYAMGTNIISNPFTWPKDAGSSLFRVEGYTLCLEFLRNLNARFSILP